MGKVLIGILGLFMLLGAFASPILDGIKGWRTNNTTESFSVATGAAVTTSNVTLSYDLYQASVPEIISITSNNTGDSAIGSAYTEATNVLLVSGLEAAKTRTLTINYYAETTDTVMTTIGPFLGILIIGGCAGFIIVGMFSHGRRR